MKKYLILFSFVALLIASVTWAIHPPAFVGNMGQSGGADPCGCNGTYDSCWTGVCTSGDSSYVCYNSGASAKAGAFNGDAQISAAYGEGGSNGLGLVSSGDYLRWPVLAEDLISADTGTVYIRLKSVTTAANNFQVWRSYGDDSNWINFDILAASETRLIYDDGGSQNSDYGPGIADNTWATIGLSWKADEAGNDWAVSTNGGTNWVEKDKDFGPYTDNQATVFLQVRTATTDDVYVAKMVTLPGYKTALPEWW